MPSSPASSHSPAFADSPFAQLGPDQVLDAIESQGFLTDLRCYALNSYENRVYQVGIEEGDPLVAKFYRPKRWSEEQILEEHQFCLELAEREIPVIAPVDTIPGRGAERSGQDGSSEQKRTLFRDQNDIAFALFPLRGGHPPELEHEETLETLGQQLGRIHAFGSAAAFTHRPSIDPMTMGVDSCEWLVDQGVIPGDVLDAYIAISSQLLQEILEAFERTPAKQIRLHGDCHRGNVLQRQDHLFFVDFDDCRQGPAIQDLWMLLAGDRVQSSWQLEAIIRGYEQFHEFDPTELRLIEALRALRQIYYSKWLASRWQDPAFPKAFPWFGDRAYWSKHVVDLKEQLSRMQEPPLTLG